MVPSGQKGAIFLAEPPRTGLLEIVPMPIYDDDAADASTFKHRGLRAVCDIPANVPLYRESAVAYVPTIVFRVPPRSKSADSDSEQSTTPFDQVPLGSSPFSTLPMR